MIYEACRHLCTAQTSQFVNYLFLTQFCCWSFILLGLAIIYQACCHLCTAQTSRVSHFVHFYFMTQGWGWSFIVLGLVMISLAALMYGFLVVQPSDLGLGGPDRGVSVVDQHIQ